MTADSGGRAGPYCVNCGRLLTEHQPWPQCLDGDQGWRRQMVAEYRDRLEHPVAFLAGQPRPRRRHGAARRLVAALLALSLLLAAMSLYNPNLNIPVISPVVCSIKGDTWYGGGILGPPGCYRPVSG